MTRTMIPDAELIEVADVVTIWVANGEAPTDVWSLADAVAWIMAQPVRQNLSLFRPPDHQVRAAWVDFDQMERLAYVLLPERASMRA